MAFIKLHTQMIVGAQKRAQVYKSEVRPLVMSIWVGNCSSFLAPKPMEKENRESTNRFSVYQLI